MRIDKSVGRGVEKCVGVWKEVKRDVGNCVGYGETCWSLGKVFEGVGRAVKIPPKK